MEDLIYKNENIRSFAEHGHHRIASGLITLEKVVENDLHFNIPIYQRLYVWKSDQIRTLLEDIQNAYIKDESYEYFLGGIMLSNSKPSKIVPDSNSGKIDLVDGQQRFTTLWLICDVLSVDNPILRNFTYVDQAEPRIHFSIREKAQEYLKNSNSFKEYLNDKGELLNGAESDVSEIIPLVEGRNIVVEILKEFQKDKAFNMEGFSQYLYENVSLTYTFIPGESDMNRVFEAMNNRGKQLEHHELLKSRLLEKISKEQRLTYALIWDACSDMNNYIEKSIKDIADLNWKDLFGNRSILYDNSGNEDGKKIELGTVDIEQLLKGKLAHNDEPISLFDILKQVEVDKSHHEKKVILEPEYSSRSIRSIISFPAFLLHTFRVAQLVQKKSEFEAAEVNDKKLLEIFDVDLNFDSEDKAKDFILQLWKLRVLFDKYVIKWIYDSEKKEEFHFIEYVQVSKSLIYNKDGSTNENTSVQRVEVTDDDIRDLVKLQGMLYHSQEMTTQYWLTPFLYNLYHHNLTSREIVKKLEVLENVLFYSTRNTSKLKERTYKINFQNQDDELQYLFDTKDYLMSMQGTGYPNYIFYKLEYILWKNRYELCKKYDLSIEKWNSFKLTAKNSVEHIFPQHSKEENKHLQYISEDELLGIQLSDKNPIDDFGNLVLLSPGMNSEYSNMPYLQKKGKYDSKPDIDSLKSELIFRNDKWNWSMVEEHRNEMINLVNQYTLSLNY